MESSGRGEVAKTVGAVLSAMHAAIAVADGAAYRKALKTLSRRCRACGKIRRNTPAACFQSAPCSTCAVLKARIEVDRLRAHWKAKNTAHLQLVTLRAVSPAVDHRTIDRELRDLEKSMERLVGAAMDTKNNAPGRES